MPGRGAGTAPPSSTGQCWGREQGRAEERGKCNLSGVRKVGVLGKTGKPIFQSGTKTGTAET